MANRNTMKKARKIKSCPACGAWMRLDGFDPIYTCEICKHFHVDRSLEDVIDRDEPIKLCNCEYCQKRRKM